MTYVFREPHTPVARWFLALRVQIFMLAIQLAVLGARMPWGPERPFHSLPPPPSWWWWLLGGAAVVVCTTIWTAFGLRRARRAVDRRVEQALEGLLSQGDIKMDPDVVARLRALDWPP